MIKEIDIDNEDEIIKECDFDYFYESEECSRELCMFYNDILRQTTNENFNYREAIIDLGRIAITLNRQYKRIVELEEQLKNAIVPKFKVEQTVWIVYDSIQSIPSECVIDKIVYDTSNLSKLLYYTKDEINWISLEKDIFATKEEAEARLRELQVGDEK